MASIVIGIVTFQMGFVLFFNFNDNSVKCATSIIMMQGFDIVLCFGVFSEFGSIKNMLKQKIWKK